MGFKEYFFKRALYAFMIWILVLIVNFAFFYTPPPETAFQPLPAQIAGYFNFIFIERFGPYAPYGTPTLDHICGVSVYSLMLLGISLAVSITLGIFLGTLASYKQGGKVDAALTVAGLAPFTFPAWWVCLVFWMYLSPPFPVRYWYSEKWWFRSPWSDIWNFIPDLLNHMVLPLLAFILVLTGIFFVITRNSLRNIYTEDYIRTAKAKGVSPLKIMFKHALRNAIIPVVSVMALIPQILVLIVIMVEWVFQRNGIGYMLMSSVIDPTYREPLPPTPKLQAVFIVFSTIIILFHFIADISLHALDPRVRVDGAGLEKPSAEDKKRRLHGFYRKKIWRFLKRFMRGYSGKIGVGIILFFAVAGLLAPYLPLPDAFGMNPYADPNEPPSFNHLLGTDSLRRDVLAMVIWGARASLIEGLGAVTLALTIGCFVGLLSGYYHDRWIGFLLDRVTDFFLSIPIIVVVVYFPMPASPIKWIVAVGLTTWTVTAKLVRAQVISAKERPFIEAARAAGAGDRYVVFRCLLPESIPAAASSVLFVVVTALSIQSCLDYLGFERKLWSRVEAVTRWPYLSWGTILSYGVESYFPLKQWWLVFPPGICIALLGLALVAIGNKIIEVTNPKLFTYLSRKKTKAEEIQQILG